MTETSDTETRELVEHGLADVVIYTQAWNADHACDPGEKPNALLHARVFVNGREVPQMTRVAVKGAYDFMTVDLTLTPSDVSIRPLDRAQWLELDGRAA